MSPAPDTPPDSDTEPRVGQGDVKLSREEFARRVRERFADPAFAAVTAEIDRVIDVAWNGYDEYRKSPRTRRAGAEFADPNTSSRSTGWRPESASPRRRSAVMPRAPRAGCW
jgi:hypothetical protein